MNRTLLLAICLLTLGAVVLPSGAAAQEDQPLEASLLLGFGGSFDEDQSGLGNSGYQLGLSLGVARRTKVGIRLGEIDYSKGDFVASISQPTFSYITVGGEYTFSERYYESGIYLALGAYKLEGFQGGRPFDDSTLGAALGVTGEFEITRRLGFVLEAAGHLADFGVARFFITAHGGVGYHF
ncbi:MAG: hypothetical protein ACE5EG_01790 [Thermoanaerobaculia bacterium]